jgi:hydroxyacyl-ACP dehydratase HTD2-like protein with hotdog domain
VHYDRPWTQTIEKHPDLLVHGPLTATLLVELASRKGDLREFEYRAKKPIYVDREVGMGMSEVEGGLEVWAEQEGRVGMTGRARFWD